MGGPASPANGEAMRLMVVDDDSLLVEQMQRHLVHRGYEVTTATSAEAALACIERADRPPQVVFTDIRMGGMDGLDLVERLKRQWPDTFLMVMTGYGTIEVAVEAMRRGAFDFVTKPFYMSLIHEKLAAIAGEIELRRELRQPLAAEEEPPADPLVWLGRRAAEVPVMLITPRSPQSVAQHFPIRQVTYHRLTTENEPHSLPPGHLFTLISRIDEFARANRSGVIYLEGLGLLTAIHGWQAIRNLMLKLRERLASCGCCLCLAVAQDELPREHREALIYMVTDELILSIGRSLGHRVRIGIMDYVARVREANFNRILKRVETRNSAALTFHLKKLVAAGLLQKSESGDYQLSEPGLAAAEVMSGLRHLEAQDVSRATALLTLPNKELLAG